MSSIDEAVTLTPQYGFFSVTVEILEDDPETGKIKKVKEEHLVDGRNCTEVENKVKKEMEGVSPIRLLPCCPDTRWMLPATALHVPWREAGQFWRKFRHW